MTFALLLFTLVVASQAQTPPKAVSIPDTPAGRRAAALLAAIESGDEAAYKQFVEANIDPTVLAQSPDAPFRFLRRAREQTGGLKVVRVERSEPFEVTLRARFAKSDRDFVYLRVQVASTPPHLINQPPRVEPAEPPDLVSDIASTVPAEFSGILRPLLLAQPRETE
jgi:hypothetical protein